MVACLTHLTKDALVSCGARGAIRVGAKERVVARVQHVRGIGGSPVARCEGQLSNDDPGHGALGAGARARVARCIAGVRHLTCFVEPSLAQALILARGSKPKRRAICMAVEALFVTWRTLVRSV